MAEYNNCRLQKGGIYKCHLTTLKSTLQSAGLARFRVLKPWFFYLPETEGLALLILSVFHGNHMVEKTWLQFHGIYWVGYFMAHYLMKNSKVDNAN